MQKHTQQILPDGVLENVSLQPYTTWRVGGVAQYFAMPHTLTEFLQLISWCKKQKLPLTILGCGANCLVADEGVKGLVVVTTNMNKLHVVSHGVVAECGVTLAQILQCCLQKGWGDMTWCAGIPSTVGGAVRGNAGAFNKTISTFVQAVLACTDKGVQWFTGTQLQFAYRTSLFKQKPYIILSVVLRFNPCDKAYLQQQMQNHIAYRKQTQPKEPSAGSVFLKVDTTSAGYYIEKAGLKGVRVGGAMVSPIHANFIINTGGATASHILRLIKLIRREVWRTFHKKLQTEISYIGGNVGDRRLPHAYKI